jgi:hypothetical protein
MCRLLCFSSFKFHSVVTDEHRSLMTTELRPWVDCSVIFANPFAARGVDKGIPAHQLFCPRRPRGAANVRSPCGRTDDLEPIRAPRTAIFVAKQRADPFVNNFFSDFLAHKCIPLACAALPFGWLLFFCEQYQKFEARGGGHTELEILIMPWFGGLFSKKQNNSAPRESG